MSTELEMLGILGRREESNERDLERSLGQQERNQKEEEQLWMLSADFSDEHFLCQNKKQSQQLKKEKEIRG